MKTYLNTINGQLVGSEQSMESINPATGEALGRVPTSTQAQVTQAIAAARAAQPAWAARPDSERKALMIKVAEVIKANAPYLSEWVTKEQGKPLGGIGPDQVPGARFELWGCEVWTQVPASLDLPVEVVFEDETRRDEVHRKPFGVIAAIAPWNWPLLIAIWQIIPSIRSGSTVVIKPSEYTTIGTLELVRLISEVLPKGVVNTVSGSGEVGSWLVSDPGIDKIMFTGSARTGSRIAEAAARNMVPTTMELGGNDAAIVLPDADPKAIAMGLFWGAFINMGQTCACAKRTISMPTICPPPTGCGWLAAPNTMTTHIRMMHSAHFSRHNLCWNHRSGPGRRRTGASTWLLIPTAGHSCRRGMFKVNRKSGGGFRRGIASPSIGMRTGG